MIVAETYLCKMTCCKKTSCANHVYYSVGDGEAVTTIDLRLSIRKHWTFDLLHTALYPNYMRCYCHGRPPELTTVRRDTSIALLAGSYGFLLNFALPPPLPPVTQHETPEVQIKTFITSNRYKRSRRNSRRCVIFEVTSHSNVGLESFEDTLRLIP